MRYLVTLEAKVYEIQVVSVEAATVDEARQTAALLVEREYTPGAVISIQDVKVEEDPKPDHNELERGKGYLARIL